MIFENFSSPVETPEAPETPEIPEKTDFTFEVKQHREGVDLYIFKDLAIAVDTTGKNYTGLPELSFGPYDNELNTGSLDQPEQPNPGVNMEYVAQCMQEVARASGIHEFWFDPYGADVDNEHQRGRKAARARLFQRVSPNIKPAPNGYGYILTV